MNGATGQLTRLVTKKESLGDCTVTELEQLVHRYPYFVAARILHVRKLIAEEAPEAEAALQSASLWMPDTLWLSQLAVTEVLDPKREAETIPLPDKLQVEAASLAPYDQVEAETFTQPGPAPASATLVGAEESVYVPVTEPSTPAFGEESVADDEQRHDNVDDAPADVVDAMPTAVVDGPEEPGLNEVHIGVLDEKYRHGTKETPEEEAAIEQFVQQEAEGSYLPGEEAQLLDNQPDGQSGYQLGDQHTGQLDDQADDQYDDQADGQYDDQPTGQPALTRIESVDLRFKEDARHAIERDPRLIEDDADHETDQETLWEPGTIDQPSTPPETAFDLQTVPYVTNPTDDIHAPAESTGSTESDESIEPAESTETTESNESIEPPESTELIESAGSTESPESAGSTLPEMDATEEDEPAEESDESGGLLPPLPAFKIEPIDPSTAELNFEPLHTVDYFASQGINFKEEDKPADQFSRQLRSFTQWLKTMKRISPAETAALPVVAEEHRIEQMAEHSVEGRDVVTEAMAAVWEKQGNKGKAIEVYQKLSLLEPSKSTYFAAKIEHLKR